MNGRSRSRTTYLDQDKEIITVSVSNSHLIAEIHALIIYLCRSGVSTVPKTGSCESIVFDRIQTPRFVLIMRTAVARYK